MIWLVTNRCDVSQSKGTCYAEGYHAKYMLVRAESAEAAIGIARCVGLSPVDYSNAPDVGDDSVEEREAWYFEAARVEARSDLPKVLSEPVKELLEQWWYDLQG